MPVQVRRGSVPAKGGLGDPNAGISWGLSGALGRERNISVCMLDTCVHHFTLPAAQLSMPLTCLTAPHWPQPMKSIAAIAVSENPLTVPQIVAAGMGVSAIVLFLGATRLISFFNKLVSPGGCPCPAP